MELTSGKKEMNIYCITKTKLAEKNKAYTNEGGRGYSKLLNLLKGVV